MFCALSRTGIIILVTLNLSSANAFDLVWSKILSCGNGRACVVTHTVLVPARNITYAKIEDNKSEITTIFLCKNQFCILTETHVIGRKPTLDDVTSDYRGLSVPGCSV